MLFVLVVSKSYESIGLVTISVVLTVVFMHVAHFDNVFRGTFNIDSSELGVIVVLDSDGRPPLVGRHIQFSQFSVGIFVSSLDEQMYWNISILKEVDHGNISGSSGGLVSGLTSLNSSLGIEKD
jgi:hypothetical protein